MKLRKLVEQVLEKIVERGKKNSRGDLWWAYTITNPSGDPYLTRVNFPRIFGVRLMLHRIHRADEDRELHSHPWWLAVSLILTGGYLEERLEGSGVKSKVYLAGDINVLTDESWHKIVRIIEPTWTLFLAGPRVKADDGTEWSFISPVVTPWKNFIEKRRKDASVV